MIPRNRTARLAAVLLLSSPLAASVQENAMRAEPWEPAVVELFESLPIQEGGRVKPVHTFASFTLLRLQGKRSLKTPAGERLGPTEWLMDTLFFPEAAGDYPTFLVQNDEVIASIGIDLEGKRKRDRYSYNELRPGIAKLFQLAREYAAIEEKDRSTVQQQIYVLASNLNTYSMLLSALEFARAELPLGGSADLEAIFGERESVGIAEVIEHMAPLASLYRGLAAHGQEADPERYRVVGGLLQRTADLVNGTEILPLIPPPTGSEATDPWLDPNGVFSHAFEGNETPAYQREILAGLTRLATARADRTAFRGELEGLHDSIVGHTRALGQYEKIPLELTYYRTKLLDYGQYLFVASFLVMAFMWLRPRSRWLHVSTAALVSVATALVCAAIVLRSMIRGRPPVTTLYETVLFVTACGAIVALFLEAVNRQRVALSAGAILGVVGLFVANGYEVLDKRDTMPSLIAVLDTNFWLATHVTSITIGYAAGMLAALMASVYLLAKLLSTRRPIERAFFKSLGRMVYGVVCFAMVFSLIGTILGGIWANDSWGRFWGWDPKENGALLIVISQLVILHARMGGYIKEHGICMATAFGGTIIAFSWWGVNLLGVGLHSYGFTSGIHQALWTYYVIQWVIVGLGGLAWMLERGARVPQRA